MLLFPFGVISGLGGAPFACGVGRRVLELPLCGGGACRAAAARVDLLQLPILPNKHLLASPAMTQLSSEVGYLSSEVGKQCPTHAPPTPNQRPKPRPKQWQPTANDQTMPHQRGRGEASSNRLLMARIVSHVWLLSAPLPPRPYISLEKHWTDMAPTPHRRPQTR